MTVDTFSVDRHRGLPVLPVWFWIGLGRGVLISAVVISLGVFLTVDPNPIPAVVVWWVSSWIGCWKIGREVAKRL